MQKFDVPEWATQVVSRIERRSDSIRYSVFLEGDMLLAESTAFIGSSGLLVWEKEVLFGVVESRHAGCYAFQSASREQDLIASQYADEVTIMMNRGVK